MKRRRALLCFITVVLALCATCGVWLHGERQQYRLNRQLIDAVKGGDTKTALVLVNAGADPNTREIAMPPPTLIQLLQRLLHRSPPADDTASALMISSGLLYDSTEMKTITPESLDENLPLLKAMLLHGANVNAQDSNKQTGLLAAAGDNRLRTAELLLQYGANVNVQNIDGTTPLMAARTVDMVRLLLSHGANPNMQDEAGYTALHHAISSDIANPLVRELLAHGASTTIRTRHGDAPLEFALQANRPDLVGLLKRGTK